MALNLKNLDDVTRSFMVAEIQGDIGSNQVYYSKFLTEVGVQEWNDLLLTSAQAYDSAWLADKLRNERLAISRLQTINKNGKRQTTVLHPENLADSEFNRYYIRGMCLRAIDEDIEYLITYRAKPVQKPVSSVGREVKAELLLLDLRTNKGQTYMDVPSNPNSGISVQFP